MTDTQICKTVEIVNPLGLHARASAKLVLMAEQYDAEVEVARGGQSVSALSIMGLMMLGAGKGEHVTLTGTGPQAEEAISAITALIADGFGERD